MEEGEEMSIIHDEEEMKDYGLIEIDGVDVAECKFFQCEDEEYTCSAEEGSIGAVVSCRSCDNCYFKQLQRLKSENEKLKQTLEKIRNKCLFCTNEKFTIDDFLNAKNEELTELGVFQRDILIKINEVLQKE